MNEYGNAAMQAGIQGAGFSGQMRDVANAMPVDTATNMTGECLAAIHELNQRLRNCADRVVGSVPQPPQPDSKNPNQPCLLETLRYLRGAIGIAHEELNRIERGV